MNYFININNCDLFKKILVLHKSSNKKMIIPIHVSVRGIALVSIIIFILGFFIVINNSKEKNEYQKVTGVVEFLENKFQNLPTMNNENFRYIKIDTYPYVFEIYATDSEPTNYTIDDLKLGDTIDVYYYEINKTHQIGVNKFLQFIDKENKAYFIRNGFQKNLGYFVLCLGIALNLMSL